ncbi:MAG: Type I restriction-modification system restriction subunit [Candidatus Daviesbacteria bacterium GW2011_GWC2_40_12]|uniref:Type I restriction enzyme endonuclease subunit n=1 Tax=Candidatus Daviesbacteria bacterium GW2011_GWC2_40_12 TaxID=1618431 RepID=A0A0G0QPU5_9BACT|nr:MAG: Type I restriction-modification system restriction subunit [Candidatus Daviesbacteria bacterium GW2011_GWC2_40_12]
MGYPENCQYFMPAIFESEEEKNLVELLKIQGFSYLSPDDAEFERENLEEVILKNRLHIAIDRLNPSVPEEVKVKAAKEIFNLQTEGINEAFHKILTNGIEMPGFGNLQIVDFGNPENNEFIVTNQFSVFEKHNKKRVNIILFINGLPLIVIELGSPGGEAAFLCTFSRMHDFKKTIPSIFYYNSLLVISDGKDARAGTITSTYSRFLAWKSRHGYRRQNLSVSSLETMICEMLNREVLLDLIKHFIVFEKSTKKVAFYHQYNGVNKAVESTSEQFSSNRRFMDNKKAGLVWHTQGSGKSYSIVFYIGKVSLFLNKPTILVIPDPGDPDFHLLETLTSCNQLLHQEVKVAQNQAHLTGLLAALGGGIIFSPIDNFSEKNHGILSVRNNIIVIAEEIKKSAQVFDKFIRPALPNACFIGFTGTPAEKEDYLTLKVFGSYIDIYDVARSVEDGTTVRVYYHSGLPKFHLKQEELLKYDENVESLMEGQNAPSQKVKNALEQLEKALGNTDRVRQAAADIVAHFENRTRFFEGKGMIVALHPPLALRLYDEIIKLRPSWHDEDLNKGAIKAVLSSIYSLEERKKLGERLNDPGDSLKIVIVCDVWLTCFDASTLHTLYIDKPMHGHKLMQITARVNQIFKDKPGGLIVDYIGLLSQFKKAQQEYIASGGEGDPVDDLGEAVLKMIEKFQIVHSMFDPFDYQPYFSAESQKLNILLDAQEHIFGLKDGKNRFIKEVDLLSGWFVMSYPHPKALDIKGKLRFFQALKMRMLKFEPKDSDILEIGEETVIRQIADEEVPDVLDATEAAGLDFRQIELKWYQNKSIGGEVETTQHGGHTDVRIRGTDIILLSDEFLGEAKGMVREKTAFELLKKILIDALRAKAKKNLTRGKKLAEILEDIIRKYNDKILAPGPAVDSLASFAKELRGSEGVSVLKFIFDEKSNEELSQIYEDIIPKLKEHNLITNEIIEELATLIEKKDESPEFLARKIQSLIEKLQNRSIENEIIEEFIKVKRAETDLSDTLKKGLQKHREYNLKVDKIIADLINSKEKIGKQFKYSNLGLSEEELAYFDILAINKNAREQLGVEKIQELAKLITARIKANAVENWPIKVSAKSNLWLIIRRTIRQYGYPEGLRPYAAENILRQAELFAEEKMSY